MNKNIMIYKKTTIFSVFSVYVSQIKDCKLIDYKLKHQDVCLNSEECFFLNESKNRYPLFYQQPPTIETRCPCKDKHNYHCGNKYCTINSLVCDHLKTTKFINKLKSIPKCIKQNIKSRNSKIIRF